MERETTMQNKHYITTFYPLSDGQRKRYEELKGVVVNPDGLPEDLKKDNPVWNEGTTFQKMLSEVPSDYDGYVQHSHYRRLLITPDGVPDDVDLMVAEPLPMVFNVPDSE